MKKSNIIKLTLGGICERCRLREAQGLVQNDTETSSAFIKICKFCCRESEELITELDLNGISLITNLDKRTSYSEIPNNCN